MNLGESFSGFTLRFRRLLLQVAALLAILFVFFSAVRIHNGDRTLEEHDNAGAWEMARDFASDPVTAPYKDKFREVGLRARSIRQWISTADKMRPGSKRDDLLEATEIAASAVFPFLNNSPRDKGSETPLQDLRSSYEKGSKGIVIAVGGDGLPFRLAGQLLVNLRTVLKSDLPIQVAYGGDKDMTLEQREKLASLDGLSNTEFLDVLSVFDDSTLDLAENGWAVKIFAVLASSFEQVILLDADAVLMQQPEVFFEQGAYTETGAYLFHDRLLWQHGFKERHEWFIDQIRDPSPEMNKSLVWTEDYAEECDSGVVVADKRRPEVFLGLLHTAWQNSRDVRDEVTFRITYGDKEAWWLGLELAGSTYRFEEHYGGMVGWKKTEEDDNGKEIDKVCSFVIAHADAGDNLLWYNGGLLKNKLTDPNGYEVPQYWMMDGTWEKGHTKQDMSCMVDETLRELSPEQKDLLERSIEVAKKVDEALGEA